MTPVRVITEGGSATLPLRMVAAGTGDHTAITLYVIAEGRYEVDGAPQVTVDTSQLTWDWNTSVSNYGAARQQALDTQGGKGWLTSFAELKAFTKPYSDALGASITFQTSSGGAGGGPGFGGPSYSNLTDLYFGQAKADDGLSNSCMGVAYTANLNTSSIVYDDCKGVTAPDAGAPAADAGRSPPPPSCPPPPSGTIAASSLVCDNYSDIAAAMIGMHPNTVWVKPSSPQTEVANTFRATKHINPPCDLLENHPEVSMLRHRSQEAGVGVLSGLGLFFARRLRRRRGLRVS
jgi:hypothetical protein